MSCQFTEQGDLNETYMYKQRLKIHLLHLVQYTQRYCIQSTSVSLFMHITHFLFTNITLAGKQCVV